MIKYLRHQEINKQKWDECIQNSPNGLIYAHSWYLDIVCPGWEALVEDNYDSVLPLPMAKKYGYTYSYQPPFTQQLGLFSIHEIPEGKTADFISAIPSHYRYIEMHLNEKNQFSSPSFAIQERVTYLLDMNRSYAEIAGAYSSQTKRNLKKALVSAHTIIQSARPLRTVKLFKDNRGLQHELPVAFYAVIEQLVEMLTYRGLIYSGGVNNRENEMCAGAFFVKSKNRDIFLFSGADKNAYDSHAMTLLINNYIEEHAGSPVILDFEGSMDTDLARFYSGFGSVKKTYLMIRRNTLPAPAKWLKEMQFKRKTLGKA